MVVWQWLKNILGQPSAPKRQFSSRAAETAQSVAVEPGAAAPVYPPGTEEESARRILASVIGRMAGGFAQQSCVSKIQLTSAQISDGVKNRLIGKEGRNIRLIEELTGADVLLNQESESITVSCFDPFRREVARATIQLLVKEGRISPGKIEESVATARKEVENYCRDQATKYIRELGLKDLHPALVRVLGTLALRASFGQNLLEHSVESAWACGALAAELGFDPLLARRTALLHDIGKALDLRHEGTHAFAGAQFAKKYGEDPAVIHAIAAHHHEVPPESWLDHLVSAVDALSAARPGARQGVEQNLIERSVAMETVAKGFEGVTDCHAFQAGRELRVFVDHEKLDDQATRLLAQKIREKIEQDVAFPGQIKVTLLRQLRVTEVAKK